MSLVWDSEFVPSSFPRALFTEIPSTVNVGGFLRGLGGMWALDPLDGLTVLGEPWKLVLLLREALDWPAAAETVFTPSTGFLRGLADMWALDPLDGLTVLGEPWKLVLVLREPLGRTAAAETIFTPSCHGLLDLVPDLLTWGGNFLLESLMLGCVASSTLGWKGFWKRTKSQTKSYEI